MSPLPPDEPNSLVRQLIRQAEAQEAEAPSGYLLLDNVRAVCDAETVEWALTADVLLVDYRTRVHPASGALEPITLCRLNRHHPLVRDLTAW